MTSDPKAVSDPEISEMVGEIKDLQGALKESELAEFRSGASQEASLEDTLGSIKDETDESTQGLLDELSEEEPVIIQEVTEEGMSMEDSIAKPNEETLTMTLSGNMKLKLNYAFGGQQVTVTFGGDAFRVSFADGTEFKIPIHGHARAA